MSTSGSLHPTHARHGIHQAAAEIPPSATPARKPKKKRMRLLQKYRAQLYRGFQGAFLPLNLALGAKFYFWVRQLESGTTSLHRPPGVEGWLPEDHRAAAGWHLPGSWTQALLRQRRAYEL
jgi:hypothetical protein